MLRSTAIFLSVLILAGCAALQNQQGASVDTPIPLTPTSTEAASEVPSPTLLTTNTESNVTPTATPTFPPTATAAPLPTPLFTGNHARAGSVIAMSPVGGAWAMGASYNIWAIAPDGTPTLLSTYTPRSINSPWPRLSPDRTKIAFGVDEGGAVYDLESGQVARFPTTDRADQAGLIDFLTWSVDSQTLYYSVWPQLWRVHLADPSHPQLISEKVQRADQECDLRPVQFLLDGRLLMSCLDGRPTTVVWDIASNTVVPLIYQTKPVMVRDVAGERLLFDTGAYSPLSIGAIGPQGEMQEVTEVSGPEVPPIFTQTTFLPDGGILVSWYSNSPNGELTPHALVLRAIQDGYQSTVLTPIEPTDGHNLDYVMAVYGERLIVVATDTTDSRAVMSEVPLDGSPARMIIEGTYQILVP